MSDDPIRYTRRTSKNNETSRDSFSLINFVSNTSSKSKNQFPSSDDENSDDVSNYSEDKKDSNVDEEDESSDEDISDPTYWSDEDGNATDEDMTESDDGADDDSYEP